ncbi:response regulator transcription factor [Saccharothrix sp. NRRL B-16314]|uniref:response regulator transcription factor n=1 Tax=Saccharothrix sp. NRRL B-16314 TaxID=1463825 RepID=UPI0005279BF8|nr:response regulator transcription factor [Saccharothrix sp. NRRL B-16314]
MVGVELPCPIDNGRTNTYLPTTAHDHLPNQLEKATPIDTARRGTHREREILALLAAGMKDAAIMRALGITNAR